MQLINAIFELRDTELSFHSDLRFMLDVLRPLTTQRATAELLFGGLEEIDNFSESLYSQLDQISKIESRTDQCMKLYKLFLDQLMTLREVYAPYCARQSQGTGQISFFSHLEISFRQKCELLPNFCKILSLSESKLAFR